MNTKKTGLSSTEIEILEMVHNLYGKRHHRSRECFTNEEGENLVFIKNRSGEAQFAVNLTLLAEIRNTFTVQLQEKYLMPDFTGESHLPRCGQNPADEYHTFITEQLNMEPEVQYERLAS